MASNAKKYQDLLTAFPYGINSGVSALLLPKEQCSFAINTTFRGGYATDRPPKEKATLNFGGDDALESAVRTGLFQGAGVYRPDFGQSQIIAQISGRLFAFTENGDSWDVTEISISGDLNDATYAQVWMWQSEKWLIITDGSSKNPIFYDGISCRRSTGPAAEVGEVAAGPVVIPAVGASVDLTLVADYTGPLNVPVTINGEQYLVTGYGPATPANQLILTSANRHPQNFPANVTLTSESNPAAFIDTDQKFPAHPTPYSLTLKLKSVSGVSVGNSLRVPISNTSYNNFVAFSIFQIVLLVNSVNTTSNTVDCTISTTLAGPYPGGSDFYFPDGVQVQFYPSTGTISTVAIVPSPFSTIFGAPTVTIDRIYSGTQGMVVSAGDYQFFASTPPIVPSNVLTVQNINATPGNNISIGDKIFSISEIPPCRMGAYGLGQTWFCALDGTSFGPSDLVGSSSGTAANNYRDAVLKTTDLDVMGYFRIPSSGEIITAMIFVATLDQALGQGPLQIGVPSGMFSCKAPFTLTDFQGITNAVTGDLVSAPIVTPILTKSLVGFGPVAQNSTIVANSDTIFRSFEGINSLILARRQFSDIGGNTPISREMTRVIDQDRKDLLTYSSAVVFDNRLRMTTSPNVSAQGVFHMGELVLNYDLISSLRGKVQPVWDGLWTGNNILQYIQGLFNTESRAFAFTFNITDSKIELYELLPTGDVHFDNGDIRIKWVIETPVIFNADIKSLPDLARLIDGEMFLSDVNGAVDVAVLYRPLFYPCWRPWHSFKICADMTASNAKEQVRYALGFGEPDPKDCDVINNLPFRESNGFQLRIEITGHAKIWGIKAIGDPVPDAAFKQPAGTCTEVAATCIPLDCDVENDLEVYSLDGIPPSPLPSTTTQQPNDFVFSFVTDSCPEGTALALTGTPLPAWITFDAAGAFFKGAFGTYFADTKAEANALAQAALDDFVATVVANGGLTCFGFPILESTVAGLGGSAPSQVTWDGDNERVWICSGWNGDPLGATVGYKPSDASITTLGPANKVRGIQYVPSVTSPLDSPRLWINRGSAIGNILPTAPNTITDVFAIVGAVSSSTVNPALWIPEKNMFFGSQGYSALSLIFERIDFTTGVRTEVLLAGVSPADGTQYTYNPDGNEIFVGGNFRVDVDTLVSTQIIMAGRNPQLSALYCPENGYVYIPYFHVASGIYGVAMMNGTTHVIDPTFGFVNLGTEAIKGLVYHEARKWIYVYTTNSVFFIDATQPVSAIQVVAGSITGLPQNISNSPAVYSPDTYRVYIATTGRLYVFT